MPSLQTWRSQVSEDSLSFNSSTIFLRDHHNPPGSLNTSNFANASAGQSAMTQAVTLWYPTPNKTNPIANFSAWCHATQLFQADLYTSEIAFYRRGSGLPERQLGSLYWQLEDIWAAPTWAGIEYDGRWKVLHYAARDLYNQLIIAPYHDVPTGNLSVWVTSDLWERVSGTAEFAWYDWAGNQLDVNTSGENVEFSVGAINSTRVLQTNTTEILQQHDAGAAVLRMRVSAQGRLPNSNETRVFAHENWFHASALRDAELVDPGLQLSYSNATRSFTVEATKGVAAWVWLEHPAGVLGNFEANAFWLAKGESREVGFTLKSGAEVGEWADGVTVQSVWDLTLAE